MKPYPARISISPFGDFTLDEFEAFGITCSYYEALITFHETDIEIVVHPPKSPISDWSDFLTKTSNLIPEILNNWKLILATGTDQLRDLFTLYGAEFDDKEIQNIITNLIPETLQIHSDDDEEIAFAPTSHFPSLDLFVAFDADWRVTNVRFDG